MTEIEVEGGLLCWDGRVVELFRSDGRTGAFRVHARTVVRREVERRRGVSLVKLYTTERHYESVLVPDDRLPVVEAMLTELDAARR